MCILPAATHPGFPSQSWGNPLYQRGGIAMLLRPGQYWKPLDPGKRINTIDLSIGSVADAYL